jgi:hypothetical protein
MKLEFAFLLIIGTSGAIATLGWVAFSIYHWLNPG